MPYKAPASCPGSAGTQGCRTDLTTSQRGTGGFQGGPLLRTSWKGLETNLLHPQKVKTNLAEFVETCESIQGSLACPPSPSQVRMSTATITSRPSGRGQARPHVHALLPVQPPPAPQATLSQQPRASFRPCPKPLSLL